VYRQKALEDALLHSGQFKEALQAVLDWLYKMEPQLGEDQLLHGDTDTVGSLSEEHKVLSLTSPICLSTSCSNLCSRLVSVCWHSYCSEQLFIINSLL